MHSGVQLNSWRREKPVSLPFALFSMRKCPLLMKLPTLQHPHYLLFLPRGFWLVCWNQFRIELFKMDLRNFTLKISAIQLPWKAQHAQRLQTIRHKLFRFYSCYYGNWTPAVQKFSNQVKKLVIALKMFRQSPRCDRNNRCNMYWLKWPGQREPLTAPPIPQMTDTMLFKKLDHLSLLRTRQAWRGPEVRSGKVGKVRTKSLPCSSAQRG